MITFHQPAIEANKAMDSLYGLMLTRDEFTDSRVAAFLERNIRMLSLNSEIFAAGTTIRQFALEPKPVPLYRIFTIPGQFPTNDLRELVEKIGFGEAALPLPDTWLPVEDQLITETDAETFLKLVVSRNDELIELLADGIGKQYKELIVTEFTPAADRSRK